jgi:hypothetical protein
VGPTDFEVWPFLAEFRKSDRKVMWKAWSAREAAMDYIAETFSKTLSLDWVLLNMSPYVYVREQISGRQVRFPIVQNVTFDLGVSIEE